MPIWDFASEGLTLKNSDPQPSKEVGKEGDVDVNNSDDVDAPNKDTPESSTNVVSTAERCLYCWT